MPAPRLFLAAFAASCLFAAIGAPVSARADEPAPKVKPDPVLETVWVEVVDVTAEEAPKIAASVSGLAGVHSFAWTREREEAKVVREVGTAGDDAVAKASKDAGAASATRVPTAAVTLKFKKALHCDGCVLRVTETLQAVKGVKDLTIAKDKTTVDVVYDTRSVKTADLEAALAAAKYPVNSPS